MNTALWVWTAGIVLSQPLVALADPARCAIPAALDARTPIVIDTARVSGTGTRPSVTKKGRVRVDVLVSAPKSAQLGSHVSVALVDAKGKVFATKDRSSAQGIVRLAQVPPGQYIVQASIADTANEAQRLFSAPAQRVVLDQDVNEVHVQFGKTGLPFFRMGKGLVPFTPTEYVAVATPSASVAKQLLPIIDESLVPLKARRMTDPSTTEPGRGSVILVKSDSGIYQPEIAERLRQRLGGSMRVGMAIDLGASSMRILDNRYVVRFHPEAAAALRSRMMAQTGLSFVRQYRRDPDLAVVAFANDAYEANLATINCLVEEAVLLTGEPDLIQRWRASGSLPFDWPDDPRYLNQHAAATHANHLNQKIREAWALLFDGNRMPPTVAKSSVTVGLMDHVIDPSDDEIGCMVDGAPQVALCWNPARVAMGSDGHCFGPVPATQSHGMNMLGIIAACTNNAKGIAGIAPGVRINAVAFNTPGESEYYATEMYSNLLLWMGGELDPCAGGEQADHPCRWPLVRSDVINNSYTVGTPDGWDGERIELPELVGFAFQTLTTAGRGGKGTILVFAAGNWEQRLATEIIAPTAADARTIGVSNCFYSGLKEQLYRGELSHLPSNIGEKIDVCANGESAETIPAVCGATAAPCPSGGTSAAAATVTGIVALMLSANPALTWQEVRQMLRDSADKIDPTPDLAEGNWQNGRSKWYGSGRVNALRAVKAALKPKRPSRRDHG